MKWEYKEIILQYPISFSYLEILGKEGWEMCGFSININPEFGFVASNYYYYFKRQFL